MTASEERLRLKELKSRLLRFSGFESSSLPRLISSNSHRLSVTTWSATWAPPLFPPRPNQARAASRFAERAAVTANESHRS